MVPYGYYARLSSLTRLKKDNPHWAVILPRPCLLAFPTELLYHVKSDVSEAGSQHSTIGSNLLSVKVVPDL